MPVRRGELNGRSITSRKVAAGGREQQEMFHVAERHDYKGELTPTLRLGRSLALPVRQTMFHVAERHDYTGGAWWCAAGGAAKKERESTEYAVRSTGGESKGGGF